MVRVRGVEPLGLLVNTYKSRSNNIFEVLVKPAEPYRTIQTK